ncbi:MotA/TolQ/ExbB proton channel family protein [Bacteriovoracaceae bacterium]|nr:MotA/TolQ/ExbB proton channel family protein [Bacteriovoracaceae bacterium]
MRLIDYIQQGGPIMYILILLNIVGISILIWRFIVIFEYKKNIQVYVDQILDKFKKSTVDDNLKINLVKDEIKQNVIALEYGMGTIKTIASISPLLGLLGTVVGILSSFQVISEQGLNNPSMFAGGIAMALLTTVGGLIVAIPHFVGHNYLNGHLDKLESSMEKAILEKLF